MKPYIKVVDTRKIKKFIPPFHILFFIMALVFVSGSLIGSLFAIFADIDYILPLSSDTSGTFVLFTDSFLKYEKTAAFIWLFAFIPSGYILVFVTLFLNGLTCGFTTSYIILNYGISGIFLSIGLYSLRELILIPTFFFIAYHSVLHNKSEKLSHRPYLSKYILIFLVSSFFILLAALCDTYIAPLVLSLS
ncbi:MAG: stage II sporulation protein M [Firmicutes bacterium]|nr:stage II sporulation protein M [Bacillota bacterium]